MAIDCRPGGKAEDRHEADGPDLDVLGLNDSRGLRMQSILPALRLSENRVFGTRHFDHRVNYSRAGGLSIREAGKFTDSQL